MSGSTPRTLLLALGILALASCLLLAGGGHETFAQGNPFGPRGAPQPEASGFVAWLFAKQSEFYRATAAALRASKADGTALITLLAISFAYGVFHAAGPGHGKAVISSYLVANEETWRRGITLSFLSAFLQAVVAIAVVGIAAVLLNATARMMNTAVNWIETISYALIIAVGVRLLWVKARAFMAEWRLQHRPKTVGAAATPADHHAHDHAHAHHAAHAPGHAHRHDHGHDHDHDHAHAHHDHGDGAVCAHCGHSHGPEPRELAGPGGWRRGLSAIVAVGLRPCSGAIILLVFALGQGVFLTGMAATFVMGLGTAITVAAMATFALSAKSVAKRLTLHRAGGGVLVLRGIEVLAAVFVILFGAALLAGYMASERMAGVI
jgi:nickel/cobalt exporter